jgi:hypothetical protein
LLKSSEDGKRKVYIDEKNQEVILGFLGTKVSLLNKFELILNLFIENKHIPRHLYGSENIGKGTEKVTAIKPTRGKINPRIYCQQYKEKDQEIFVIVVSELLRKKKNEGLSKVEKGIINKVASHQYNLKDE